MKKDKQIVQEKIYLYSQFNFNKDNKPSEYIQKRVNAEIVPLLKDLDYDDPIILANFHSILNDYNNKLLLEKFSKIFDEFKNLLIKTKKNFKNENEKLNYSRKILEGFSKNLHVNNTIKEDKSLILKLEKEILTLVKNKTVSLPYLHQFFRNENIISCSYTNFKKILNIDLNYNFNDIIHEKLLTYEDVHGKKEDKEEEEKLFNKKNNYDL